MNNLKQFYGTEQHHKGFFGVTLTDGCYFIAENGASWLISDISVILKINAKVKNEEFISIKVKIQDKKAVVVYTDGNNNKLYNQKYEYTDFNDYFEEKEVNFYYTDNVLMLSGEY